MKTIREPNLEKNQEKEKLSNLPDKIELVTFYPHKEIKN
jgi:hypothetical protein